MEATQVDWISKEEAGLLLGISSRRVLELAKEGRIESARAKDPNNGQSVVRIHAGSIERYLWKKRHPDPIPPPEVREPHTSQAITRRIPGLSELVNMLRDGYAAEPAHLWLTLREASDYSGLPTAILLDFITAGRLATLDVGRRRRGGRWRIRKTDLEQFSG